jgi:hypothetical protein
MSKELREKIETLFEETKTYKPLKRLSLTATDLTNG